MDRDGRHHTLIGRLRALRIDGHTKIVVATLVLYLVYGMTIGWLSTRKGAAWPVHDRTEFQLGCANLISGRYRALMMNAHVTLTRRLMTTIEIEYCEPCGLLDNALETADRILAEFGRELEGVTLTPGHGGVFKIYADGDLIYDKNERGYDIDAIVTEISKRKSDNASAT